MSSSDWEVTAAYNADVEAVMELIHEYLDHRLSGDQADIDQDIEDSGAFIVDRLFSRWFGSDYTIERIRGTEDGLDA